MQALSSVDQLFGVEMRRRRRQAQTGKRQARSFVESAVSSSITRAARAYMDGLSFCSFSIRASNDVQASAPVVDEIRQQLIELFGADEVKVDDCSQESRDIYVFIGFPRTR